MSLDVYLEGPESEVDCSCPNCSNTHKTKWRDEFFGANITHNLGAMAEAIGVYQFLWRPDEIGIVYAKQLIAPLSVALDAMRENPAKFRALDAMNGWGVYDDFLPWIERYRDACREHPEAFVRVSR